MITSNNHNHKHNNSTNNIDDDSSNKHTRNKRRRNFWKDPATHRAFFEQIACKLQIRNAPDDWYRVTVDDIRRCTTTTAAAAGDDDIEEGGGGGGGGLLVSYYKNSLWHALQSIYPEIEWHPWRFRHAPRRLWDNLETQRHFFDWAAQQLGITTTTNNNSNSNSNNNNNNNNANNNNNNNDNNNNNNNNNNGWYAVRYEDIERLGGRRLLEDKYGKSLVRALQAVYPEVEWLPWRFQHLSVPRNFWSSTENQRRFFDWAARELGLERLEDWYDSSKAGPEHVRRLGGHALLSNHFKNSLPNALQSAYPEFPWRPWLFSVTPKHFFSSSSSLFISSTSSTSSNGSNGNNSNNIENQRRFFDWAEGQLSVAVRPDDWYHVDPDQVRALPGGEALLKHAHKNSLMLALRTVYPDVRWQPWLFRFCRPSQEDYDDKETLRAYLEYIAREDMLHIRHLDDWYRVSMQQIDALGIGFDIIRRHGGLHAALMIAYPKHNWDESKFATSNRRGKKASQRHLLLALKSIFNAPPSAAQLPAQ